MKNVFLKTIGFVGGAAIFGGVLVYHFIIGFETHIS